MLQHVCFTISAIALLVISLTMLARANDLRWRKGLHWNVRLIGFIMSGVSPYGIIGYELAMQEWPSLYEAIFRAGIMAVFVTTPYLPPWWKWISGVDPDAPIVESDDRRARATRKTALDRRRDETP